MKMMMLAFGTAAIAVGTSVTASVSAAPGPSPTIQLAAVTDACPLAAITVLGSILCSVLGL